MPENYGRTTVNSLLQAVASNGKIPFPGAQRQIYRKASHEDEMLSKEGLAFGLCERNYDYGQTETRDDLLQRKQPVGRRMLSQSFVRT